MDSRLRDLERRASQGDSDALESLIQALLKVGNVDYIFDTLRRVRNAIGPVKAIEDSLLAKVLKATCETVIYADVVNYLRLEAIDKAVETGIWHGILALPLPEIRRLNAVISNGFFDQFDGGNEEDWRAGQDEALYTYYQGASQRQVLDRQSRALTEKQAIWAELDCKLGEAKFAISWLDNGDYLPDWDGVGIEETRKSGKVGQILGSYQLMTKEDGAVHGEEPVSDTLQTIRGPRRIMLYPEMWLHIVACNL